MRKAQASIEFTILVAFALLFLSITSAAFLTQTRLLQEEIKLKQLAIVGDRVQSNINLAAKTDGFFYHPFVLPYNIEGHKYDFVHSNYSDHFLINSSFGDYLVFVDDNITLFTGNSSDYCVGRSDEDIIFGSKKIAMRDGALYIGCVDNLKNVTLRFTSTPDNPVSTPALDLFNTRFTISGDDLTIESDGLTGVFIIENVDAELDSIIKIDRHLEGMVVG